ncbi:MAG TPA: bifunctional adenosylcobinamide kinase/adenosylcobinamide-phosphate guanylyltransferase [Halanaerobiales bacterium]|nr:bifunctional adenosylcobinamide kinase/adenosylcobinamide-phosphate guanylyltransferase [Halanaerobiales bacterium]
MSQIFLIMGGARSGKSSFAEEIAEKLSKEEVIYLATAQALDQEMEERITHHKKQRPQAWETIEEPLALSEVIENVKDNKTVLMDCLTLFISNMILKQAELDKNENNLTQKFNIEQEIINEIETTIKKARKNDLNLIIVSNQVGQGVVPNNELGRLFRDIAGRANQFVADTADRVFMTIAGYPIDLNDISMKNKTNFLDNLEED